jgi:hypothetical protein
VTLPNAERAIVDLKKLCDYCLSAQHPRGRHKARVFESALGFGAANAEELREVLLAAARSEQAVPTEQDDYGQRYVVDVVVSARGAQATVRSAWIVRRGEDFPRLTSCYVL